MADAAPGPPPFALATALAPPAVRPALDALWTLDARFGTIVATTSDVLIGQMRIAWWRDALARLDTAAAPAEPVLQALACEVLPRGVTGTTLAGLANGWEAVLVAAPGDRAALADYAAGRGETLFLAAAQLLGASDPRVAAAGRAWALSDPAVASTAQAGARDMAAAEFAAAFRGRWPRSLRAIGALALLADLASGQQRSRSAQIRDLGVFLRFRITGRR